MNATGGLHSKLCELHGKPWAWKPEGTGFERIYLHPDVPSTVGLLCRGCENQFFRNGHIILGCSDETGVQQMMPKPSEQTSRSPVSSPCHSISRKKRKDLMQLSAFCFRFVFSIYTCFVNLILSILVWDTLCACCSLCENPANSPRRMCRAA